MKLKHYTISTVVNNHLCSGCGTCNVSCPIPAISMRYNSMGQLLPRINMASCTECGLCYNVCPSIDTKGVIATSCNCDDLFVGSIQQVYTGKSTDATIYKNAQSGGAATAILSHLLKTGEIDAAIVCKDEFSTQYAVRATVAKNAEELMSCQKSKYVPIDIVSALQNIGKETTVAIVGLGCHIQGCLTLIRSFPGKYCNIKYLIGLICEGPLCRTGAHILLDSSKVPNSKKLTWKDKKEHYKKAKTIVTNFEGNTVEIPSWKRHYLKKYFIQPRCRICFDKLNTMADITLGDPWGMSGIDWDRGESLVITRTNRGEQLIRRMIEANELYLRDASLQEVLSGQGIEKKKLEVKTFIREYRDRGWLIPQYYDKFKLNGETSTQKASRMISRFLKDGEKTEKGIIQRYLFKIHLKQFLLKFRYLFRKSAFRELHSNLKT